MRHELTEKNSFKERRVRRSARLLASIIGRTTLVFLASNYDTIVQYSYAFSDGPMAIPDVVGCDPYQAPKPTETPAPAENKEDEEPLPTPTPVPEDPVEEELAVHTSKV